MRPYFIQNAAIMPPTIAAEARNTAAFCQRFRPVTKARYNTINANQSKAAITVAITLDARETTCDTPLPILSLVMLFKTKRLC